MHIKKLHFGRTDKLSLDVRGQALIETAIGSVVITLMVAIACNFAYLAYLNNTTSSAARQAAVAAIQGQKAMSAKSLPTSASVCAVASNEVNSWLAVSDGDWSATVASAPAGSTSWSQPATCTPGNSVSPAFAADPESAYFGSTAVVVTGYYNMPIQFNMWGLGSVAKNVLLTSHTLYVRQLN